MSISEEELYERFQTRLSRIREEIEGVVVGQKVMVEAMLCTLLSRGHILLEGVPGLAKSLAVSTFARAIGGEFQRIQFTPDKLPGDITGTTVYNEATGAFELHKGPIFCHILLADEINRAAPKVQSALLEAMQEKVVTIERKGHPLPDPFMVLATQNPVEQWGTYPLSEAQLDRFMAKVRVEYPSRKDEAFLLRKKTRQPEGFQSPPRQVSDPAEIVEIQEHAAQHVRVSEAVLSYILRISLHTRLKGSGAARRPHGHISVGVSPRGGEHLIAFCKSFAYLKGRPYVTFEDVDRCAPWVLGHRIILSDAAVLEGRKGQDVVEEILRSVSPYGEW